MKLYLGRLELSAPDQTRTLGEIDGKLIELNLAYAAYLKQARNDTASAHELAAYCFPRSIAEHLAHGEAARKSLDDVVAFARQSGASELGDPAGEKIVYDVKSIRWVAPFVNPEKSFAIDLSDHARTEAIPQSTVPAGFTSCRKPSLVAVRRSAGRDSRKKSKWRISVNSTTASSPHEFLPVN